MVLKGIVNVKWAFIRIFLLVYVLNARFLIVNNVIL